MATCGSRPVDADPGPLNRPSALSSMGFYPAGRVVAWVTAQVSKPELILLASALRAADYMPVLARCTKARAPITRNVTPAAAVQARPASEARPTIPPVAAKNGTT